MTVSQTNVIAARIEDKPGSLNQILDVLYKNDISVEYAYAFITRKEDDAYVILRVEDVENSISTLQTAGVQMLPAEEVYKI